TARSHPMGAVPAGPTTPDSATLSATIDTCPFESSLSRSWSARPCSRSVAARPKAGPGPRHPSPSAMRPRATTAPCAAAPRAARYDDRLWGGAKLGEQVRLVQGMVDAAPAKIRPDAQRFVDALRRVETDNSVKDDPNVKRAVDNVNRFAAQACGFYEQQGGGG